MRTPELEQYVELVAYLGGATAAWQLFCQGASGSVTDSKYTLLAGGAALGVASVKGLLRLFVNALGLPTETVRDEPRSILRRALDLLATRKREKAQSITQTANGNGQAPVQPKLAHLAGHAESEEPQGRSTTE